MTDSGILVVNGIFFDENRRLLLVRKGDFWILPGGKKDQEESDADCLRREILEELPRAIFSSETLRYFRDFQSETPRRKAKISITCYFGGIKGDICPAAEISEACWMTQDECLSSNLSPATRMIVSALVDEGMF